MRAQQVALGFKAHTGWAAVVAVAGTKDALEIVAKHRIEMAAGFDEAGVYHAAEPLGVAEAGALISQAEKKFGRSAEKAIIALIKDLSARGYSAGKAAVVANSAKPLPDLAAILKSHALIHTAEGELFRRVLEDASQACGVESIRVRVKELPSRAGAALHVSEADLEARLSRLGKASGRPWTIDQKEGALAAITALFESAGEGG